MILFFTILGSIITLFLGFLVYFHDTESASNRIFFLQTLATAAWSIVNYLSLIASPAHALVLIRLALFFAVPHVFIFIIFVMNFPKKEFSINRRGILSLLGLMFVLMGLTLSPYIFSSVEYTNNSAVPVPGSLIPFFGIFIVGAILLTFGLIFIKYRKSQGAEKKQWADISTGLVLTYSLIISFVFIAVVIFKDSYFVQFAGLFVLPIVFGTSYAILRHRFLNVKVIATEIVAFFLVFVSIWQILLAKTNNALILQIVIATLLLVFSVLLVRSVLREVHQREQLETLSKQLESANVQLKKLDEAKSEFLSVASHQLRTPLTAIKGYISMLQEGDFGPVSPQQMDIMKIMYDSSQRLVELIADLLDLSRIESGRMEFNFEAVNICEIIESVIEEVKPKAAGHGLYVFFDQVNSTCPDIRADREKLRQVVINLIDNAIKYTMHGGVTLRLHQMDGKLLFTVKDTGIGIDPADQIKLFQKFFRADAANEITREGTGLGIYVVKKLVEAQGGKIWFESEGLGKGTAFTVSFDVPTGVVKQERINIEALF